MLGQQVGDIFSFSCFFAGSSRGTIAEVAVDALSHCLEVSINSHPFSSIARELLGFSPPPTWALKLEASSIVIGGKVHCPRVFLEASKNQKCLLEASKMSYGGV